MKKIFQHVPIVGMLAAMLVFSACNKNNEPGKPTAKFGTTGATYSENAGQINIPVTLDKTQGQDVSVNYTWAGKTATFLNGDFKILTPSPIVVKAGELTANIEIEIINDTQLDSTDVVSFFLSSAGSNAKLSGTPSELGYDLIINSDDVAQANRLQIDLTWSVGPGGDVDQADLDLALQDSVVINGSEIEDTGLTFTASANSTGFETVYLDAADPDQDYYVAIPYINGTVSVTYYLNLTGLGWAANLGGSNASDTYAPTDASNHTATFYGSFTKDGSSFTFNGRRMPTTPQGSIVHFKVRDFTTR